MNTEPAQPPGGLGEGLLARIPGQTRRARWPDFLNRINLLLVVQPRLQKYSHSPSTQITPYPQPSRPPQGRIAIVTDAGWDAMDAAAMGARSERMGGFAPGA